MAYRDTIRETLARIGRLGYSLRLVEAWMRAENPTLDGLSPSAFAAECEAACGCIDADPRGSEALADAMGMERTDARGGTARTPKGEDR